MYTYTYIYIYTYRYIYIYIYICTHTYIYTPSRPLVVFPDRGRVPVLSIQEGIRNERNKKPNPTGRTEPFNPGTGLNRNPTRNRAEPNRTRPSHATSEKRRPNRVERTGKIKSPNRSEPMNFRKVRNRNESNRTGSFQPITTDSFQMGVTTKEVVAEVPQLPLMNFV